MTDQNAAITITITPHDLPLFCSGPQNETWNGHPRVFLPIRSNSTIACPYCGAVYQLVGEAKGHH
ncbi:zinc-finger domain-containing protein [Neisseria dentiae]|uniref:zinc-finger domain-containing protein n=1 Tax=Neisseria dentiae TaxID=194197 RepID=UPI0035A0767D